MGQRVVVGEELSEDRDTFIRNDVPSESHLCDGLIHFKKLHHLTHPLLFYLVLT